MAASKLDANFKEQLSKAALLCERLAETANLMVGMPDYDTYVAHRSAGVKVALGSSSLTVPSNSSNSSLAIRPLNRA